MVSSDCQTIAAWLAEARCAVAFTGAGMSTESGIPDFRSPGGIWSKYQPIGFSQFMSSADARYEYWRRKCEGYPAFADAEPNAGHRALARWESIGRLAGVITQNIDGLHQMAGSQRVMELHGTDREVECLDCRKRYEIGPMIDQFQEQQAVPACAACGSRLMKHATISFGQPLAPSVLQAALALTKQVDLMIVLGSSLVVEPAASLPRKAKQNGARLVIVNREPTPQDPLADLVLHQAIGETLTGIDAAVEERLKA